MNKRRDANLRIHVNLRLFYVCARHGIYQEVVKVHIHDFNSIKNSPDGYEVR